MITSFWSLLPVTTKLFTVRLVVSGLPTAGVEVKVRVSAGYRVVSSVPTKS